MKEQDSIPIRCEVALMTAKIILDIAADEKVSIGGAIDRIVEEWSRDHPST